jgi:gamma-glutamylcysteine synthetase
MDEIEKIDPKELEEIKQQLAKSDGRHCKVTEMLSNSMEELMSERIIRREMEKRLEEMEVALASERMQRGQNVESQLGTHRAEPAAAGRRTITSSPRFSKRDSDM